MSSSLMNQKSTANKAISLRRLALLLVVGMLTEQPASLAASDGLFGDRQSLTESADHSNWLDSFRASGRAKLTPSAKAPLNARPISRPQEDEVSADDLGRLSHSFDGERRELVEPAEPFDDLSGSEILDESIFDEGVGGFSEAPAFSEIGDDLLSGERDLESFRQSQPRLTTDRVFSNSPSCVDVGWQVLPNGLLHKSYLAGEKESRMQFTHRYDRALKRTVWDATLGGRVGLLRYGTYGADNPQGFQLDLDGAVFARVLPEEVSAMLEGADFRVGLYGTWRFDRWSYRAGYYHISSHLGDEYLLANPTFVRINYVRDSLLAAVSYQASESLRVYGEVGYALGIEGGAKPLEFQTGAEFTPVPRSGTGAPFLAFNRHAREDFDFKGGANVVAGWGWQGEQTNRRLRIGLSYYYGPSLQYSFFDRHEELIGGGIWLDY